MGQLLNRQILPQHSQLVWLSCALRSHSPLISDLLTLFQPHGSSCDSGTCQVQVTVHFSGFFSLCLELLPKNIHMTTFSGFAYMPPLQWSLSYLFKIVPSLLWLYSPSEHLAATNIFHILLIYLIDWSIYLLPPSPVTQKIIFRE